MENYIGTIIVAALILLGILLLLYLLLTRRGREPVHLPSVDEEHYLEGEELVRADRIHFASAQSTGFFGRVSLVRRVGTDEHGLCLFPSPHFVDKEVCNRFTEYATSVTKQPIEGMAPLLWWRSDHKLIGFVQEGLVREDGHLRMTLREYLLDRSLEPHQMEGILLSIAHVLRKLHERGFFHGWLLPRSLYVICDQERLIQGICVADGGLAYALGAEKVYAQLQRLKAREIGMDAYRRHRLLNELVHLSPEQQQKERLSQVGPASDLYAFGSIGARLFSEAPLYGAGEVDWNVVPEKWRTFFQACIAETRPTWESFPHA